MKQNHISLYGLKCFFVIWLLYGICINILLLLRKDRNVEVEIEYNEYQTQSKQVIGYKLINSGIIAFDYLDVIASIKTISSTTAIFYSLKYSFYPMIGTNYIYEDNLETSRIRTRFLSLVDVKPWANFFKDPEAVELFPTFGLTTDEERAKHWVEKQLGRYATKRYGLQALIDKKTNEFIGQCGLLMQEVDGKKEIEVAYHIFKKYWGKGYAPEAAGAFIEYAFKNDLTSSVISIIDKRNIKSQRVAEKNGLIREKETKWSGMDVFVYRIANRNKYPLLHPLN